MRTKNKQDMALELSMAISGIVNKHERVKIAQRVGVILKNRLGSDSFSYNNFIKACDATINCWNCDKEMIPHEQLENFFTPCCSENCQAEVAKHYD